MIKSDFTIISNEAIAKDIFKMVLKGDGLSITAPGQFIDLKLDELFLRRPFSVCDYTKDSITIIYKVIGKGTEKMQGLKPGTVIDVLSGLGNGFNVGNSGLKPLIIGGGVGIPPLFRLAKELRLKGLDVTAILGFNCLDDMFFVDEFKNLGVNTYVSTVDGSFGQKGFVTDVLKNLSDDFTYFYSCGPKPMLKAVYDCTSFDGELSFEERMGCGYGACMGCSCKTKNGVKRICKEGPVLKKEEVIW